MSHWRNICCAVDLRAPSRMAMEHAAALAKRFEAELTLVHVVAPPLQAASDVLVASRGIARWEAEEKERMLQRWAADVSPRAGRPVRARVLSGEPAAALVAYAREVSCDLLVVGARRPMGMMRAMRSLAGRLSRTSPCPVMVVHDHELREREVKEREREEAALYQ